MVADTKATVADTHTIVANTGNTVADTNTMVADIHRNVMAGKEGVSSKNHSVGVVCYPSTTECSSLRRIKPGQRY
jgi:hypothetical protein